MEFLPILKVIEVDGVKNGSGVGDSDGAENGGTGGVIVIVSHDSRVVGVDRGGIERAPFLVKNPLLALGIGGLGGLDVVEESLPLNAEGIEGHLVETCSGSGIVAVKLSDSVEGSLLPETGEVEDAEGAGDAGGDGGNDLAHVSWMVCSIRKCALKQGDLGEC